jgi:predicted MFS family arabinose efflux permease
MSTHVPKQPRIEEVVTPRNRLFLNRNFTFLAIGQAISHLGDFVYSTTLLVWVFTLTHSAAAVSGVLIAQYVPMFLLGPVAGVFVDRWNRRTTMVVSDLSRMTVALLPLFVTDTLRLPTIYLSVFLISVFSRFFTPARAGITQVIVTSKQQAQAASVGQATFALAMVLGPALATPLFFAVGPFIACSINAASFLVSALCLLALRAPRAAFHPSLLSEKSGLKAVGSELSASLRLIITTRVLRVSVGMALIAMLGAGAIEALGVIFVSQRLHVSSSLYGPLVATGGVGILIGAVLAGLLATKMTSKTILTGSVFLLGLGFVIYGFQTWYVAALLVYFLLSTPNGGVEVGFAPMMLNATPRAMIGRVQAVMETVMFGTSLVSIALAGAASQFIPVWLIFVISGVLMALAGLFGWFALPGGFRPKGTEVQAASD